MALIQPSGPSWAYFSDNLDVTGVYKDAGALVTAAANNTKGSIVTALSALAHDVEYLRIGIHGYCGSGVNSSTLIDIMIDYAGGTSWETDPLIPNLLGGFTSVCYTDYASSAAGITCWYDFPLWVPAGASLGARAQTAHTADITTGRVVLQAYGGNRNPASWWCGQHVTAIGINTSLSTGQLLSPALTPSFSSWANVGSTLTADAYALQAMLQGEGDTALANSTTWAKIGVSGTQIGPILSKGMSSYESGVMMSQGLLFCNFPSGTQFQASMSKTYSFAGDTDVAIYAVH